VRVYLGDPATAEIERAAIERARGVIPVPDVFRGNRERRVRRRRNTRATRRCGFHGRNGVPRAKRYIQRRYDAEAWRRFLYGCADSNVLCERLGGTAAEALRAYVDLRVPEMAALSCTPGLVHGDFSRSNIVLRASGTRWRVAGIIDWEYAFAGSRLYDIGHFMRYEDARAPSLEPHFTQGFQAGGGTLPNDWRRICRDLAALAGALTKTQLPTSAMQELRAFLLATISRRRRSERRESEAGF
jgi:aminoglycoside phosphotransferase (APT) family kinase protein